MAPATYASLPTDVRDGLGDTVTMDDSIPAGTVRVFGGDGARDMPVSAFVKARRSAHKRERQNRKRGRR